MSAFGQAKLYRREDFSSIPCHTKELSSECVYEP